MKTLVPMQGQAMTEFVVSVAFAFLPLFVLVPTLGKVIDIQHKNQLAARYAAWERTVWFDDTSGRNRDDFVTTPASWNSPSEGGWVAVRDEEEIANSLVNRFFITPRGVAKITDADTAPPPRNFMQSIQAGDRQIDVSEEYDMWGYQQSGNVMYAGTRVLHFSEDDVEDTPALGYEPMEFIAQGIATITDPINEFLSAVPGGILANDNEDLFGFPLLTDHQTFYTPIVSTQLDTGRAHGGGRPGWDENAWDLEDIGDADGDGVALGIESAIFQVWDGEIRSQSAILADGWSAQSVAHYRDRVDDQVPSGVLDNDLVNFIIDAVSFLEGGPSNSAIDKFGFGAVGVEPLPLSEIDCDGGICQFE